MWRHINVDVIAEIKGSWCYVKMKMCELSPSNRKPYLKPSWKNNCNSYKTFYFTKMYPLNICCSKSSVILYEGVRTTVFIFNGIIKLSKNGKKRITQHYEDVLRWLLNNKSLLLSTLPDVENIFCTEICLQKSC